MIPVAVVLYAHNYNNTIIKGRTKVPLEKYVPLILLLGFEKGYSRFACERELETERNCNILTPTLMAVSVVSFSFSRAAQPEAQRPSSLLDDGFLYCILSATSLVPKLHRGSRGPLRPGVAFLTTSRLYSNLISNWSLTRLVSNSLTLFRFSHKPPRASGAWRHPHPVTPFRLGLLWHLSDTSILPHAPALTPASMLHLTNPCAEPKGSQPN